MAGAGVRLFTAGQILTASQVNEYLQDQVVCRFADAAARDAAFGGVGEPTLSEGRICYLDSDNTVYLYNGSSWVEIQSGIPGTAGQVLVYNGSGDPTAQTVTGDITISSSAVASIAAGAIVNADVNASAAIALSKLASGTAGQVIVHNASGVPTATTVSGDVVISSTGTTSIEPGAIVNADINASAAIALAKLANGTPAQVVVANSSGVPTYTTLSGDVTINSSGVTTISADSVTLGTDTTGNYVASLVAGTGVTLTNATPAEAGTPTIAIGQAVETTSEVTFSNIKTTSTIEVLTIAPTAATGTINLDVANGTTYYTSNSTGNFTVNLRWNSGTSLNTKLAVGEMATTTFMVTNGGTAYLASSYQIGGNAVTPRWQGGTAPVAGNANSVDMYTYTVVKTAANTFSLFAALTRFA